jgi:hypothetical protein
MCTSLRLAAHFGQWLAGCASRAERAPVAGGSRADIGSGEENLPAAQAGAGHARDAPWDRHL